MYWYHKQYRDDYYEQSFIQQLFSFSASQELVLDLHLEAIEVARTTIINFIKSNPYFKCLNTTIGYSDLEMEFHIKGMDTLNFILDEINERFPGSIRESFYLRTRETHKERWLPELNQ